MREIGCMSRILYNNIGRLNIEDGVLRYISDISSALHSNLFIFGVG